MSHVFDRYLTKHGHYPRVVVRSGSQRLTVEFARGYLSITTSPYGGCVYITRSAWLRLIGKLVPYTRLWVKNPAEDFDVPDAKHRYYLDEVAHSQELRRQKRARKEDPEARERQRKRWLKARARAARRDET